MTLHLFPVSILSSGCTIIIIVDEAIAYAQQKMKSEFTVQEAALIIRFEVSNLINCCESLPYALNASDITKGEVNYCS